MDEIDLGLVVDDSRPPYTVLAVTGEVDVYTSSRLREKILELMHLQKHRLVIDLEKTEFLDSTGLGVLVGASMRLRATGGTLTVVCNQPHIRRTLEVTNLERVFNVRDSVEAATAS